MSNTENLRLRMRSAAERLDVATSTLGRMVGQGGKFYERLEAGKRVWPETERKVVKRLDDLLHEKESVTPDTSIQGSVTQ